MISKDVIQSILGNVEDVLDLIDERLDQFLFHRVYFDRTPVCYRFLFTCSNPCLDWRDICDLEWDCNEGEDERHCEHLEINTCNNITEYRCRNSLCIDRQFLLDGQPDCLDATDEQNSVISKTQDNYLLCNSFANRFYPYETKSYLMYNESGPCKCYAYFPTNRTDECIDTIKCAIFDENYECIIKYNRTFSYLINQCFSADKRHLYSKSYFLSPIVKTYYLHEQFLTDDFTEIYRPGLICLEGKFKCRGIEIRYYNNDKYCFNYSDIYENNTYPFLPFEFLFCQNQTHNHPSYCNDTKNFYICPVSGECISNYRLHDGFTDCIDGSDERYTSHNNLDSYFTRDRFHCEINTEQTIMFYFVGKKCGDPKFFSHCNVLKENFTLKVLVPFDHLCNSIWDFRNGLDEIDCLEWICETDWYKSSSRLDSTNRWTGNCVHRKSFKDKQFDFPDGSDEICTVKQMRLKKCNNCSHPHHPLLKCSDVTTINNELPCTIFANDVIECLGGIDERMTYACSDGLPLDNRFLCQHDLKCIEQIYLCDNIRHCSNGEDESFELCGTNNCGQGEFDCQENSTRCIPNTWRCDNENDCIENERDEKLCIVKRVNKNYKSIREPLIVEPKPRSVLKLRSNHQSLKKVKEKYDIKHANEFIHKCNSGVPVMRLNEEKCLCPAHVHGDLCQYYSHHLTVVFELNITSSKNQLQQLTPVVKIGILLNYKDKINDHLFLTRNILNRNTVYRKNRLYLNYPFKQVDKVYDEAFFNNYKVQFLLYNLYERNVSLFAVWQYNIKFPFLPAYRLATVLNLDLKYQNKKICAQHACSIHGQCYVIQNNESLYYCSCDYGYSGQFCNETHDQCNNCTNNSLCLPTYSNQYFYCVCPLYQFGLTCHLEVEQCDEYLCENNGTCLTWIDEYHQEKISCLCHAEYFGQYCEDVAVSLSLILEDDGGDDLIKILQMMDTLNNGLLIVSQQILNNLKLVDNNTYLINYGKSTLSEIVLLKTYSMNQQQANMYLVYYNLNMKPLTIINNKTKCSNTNELNLIPNSYTFINDIFTVLKKYQRPCQIPNQISCFYDLNISYLCFCDPKALRADCYYYDFDYDKCSYCLNNGRCYRGEKDNSNDFLCKCLKCQYGEICEYSTENFAFSLQTLLLSFSSEENVSRNKGKDLLVYSKKIL
ncbi:unnamed protein product [Didymodactylos carnosus]|uniref:EGF-like domain-containing protein n=1 Tax=Didymodactylos carnosus TaxID=1234261 RepID=A0A815JIP8_9BILA|nr:unnamed protein product [Didymodactylos carnosus]CAF4268469.1 unnamed protein product [Didymodactylos carnosus]